MNPTPARLRLFAATLLALAASAVPSAVGFETTVSYDFIPDGVPRAIPDAQLAPTVLELDLAASGLAAIQSVELDLRLAGTPDAPGFAGDMIVYLVHDLEQTAFLLNRVGVGVGIGDGAATGFFYSGWNVTFSDEASGPGIHDTEPGSDLMIGSWAPDARAQAGDPTDLAHFGLGIFAGAPADGTWHLALVDASPGGTMWLEGATLRLAGETTPVVPETGAGGVAAAAVLAGAILARRAGGK